MAAVKGMVIHKVKVAVTIKMKVVKLILIEEVPVALKLQHPMDFVLVTPLKV